MLQEINSAVNDPALDLECLNKVINIIQDSGNYITDQHNFTFDWFNLDKGTVNRKVNSLSIHSLKDFLVYSNGISF
jgi:hypothetical protein